MFKREKMKHSTKIIFLGLLSSIALIATCIYFKYDMVRNNIDMDTNSKILTDINDEEVKVDVLPQVIEPIIKDIQKVSVEKVIKEEKILQVSSLDYKIEEELITIDGEMPILENNDTLKLMLMSRCEKVKCNKKIHFSEKQVYPKWKELATKTINLFHNENIKMANLTVKGNSIRISGEFQNKESMSKLEKLLKPYLVIYNIKNETTVKEVKEDSSTIDNTNIDDTKVEKIIPKISNIEIAKEKTPQLDTDNKLNSKNSSMKIVEEKISDILKEKNINFYKGSANITRKGQKTLDQIIVILKKQKDINIEVHGHTDASGAKKINQWISTERAKSVKNYLGSKGLNSKNIIAKGFGETKLLLKNRPNNGINRRVEIKIKRR